VSRRFSRTVGWLLAFAAWAFLPTLISLLMSRYEWIDAAHQNHRGWLIGAGAAVGAVYGAVSFIVLVLRIEGR
jgi:hypothetical protein